MTSGMLQTSPSLGPRFRPYASPNHQVTKGRYITSNDPRGYIPVYEYPLNGQWIMMDIDDGYILWTGIWKALGNSKADIVKMIDSQPDLAPLIRRVRGGYLKIQGTWMPYEVALRLSRRVAWTIREDLIPLFGPTFPSTCLSPDQLGYGQVVASGTARRRARRNTQVVSTPASTPHEAQTNWTIVTPTSAINATQIMPGQPPPFPSSSTIAHLHYPPDSHYSSDQQSHLQRDYEHTTVTNHPSVTTSSSASPPSSSIISHDRGNYTRYSPYPGPSTQPIRRQSSSSRGSIALDIPSLSLHDYTPESQPVPRAEDAEQIILPPIQAPSHRNINQSSYALPPISALEDLRGIHTQDSAAVLRRLQSDDDSYSEPDRPTEEQLWKRRRSLSAPPYKIPSNNILTWPQPQPSGTAPVPRSFHEQPSHRVPRHSENDGFHSFHNSQLSLSVPSDPSHDGNSTCDPSPVSPATPRSATSAGGSHLGLIPLSVLKEPGRMAVPSGYTLPRVPLSFNNEWTSTYGAGQGEVLDSDRGLSACRRSCDEDSDNDSTHLLRPW